jgi:peptidoglycan hydrolase CwlO-like protein
MEQALIKQLENLNEKLDMIIGHVEKIEAKVDKIDERQSEQSRIIGEYRVQIKHLEDDIIELKKKHTADLNIVWNEFRRKEKTAYGFIVVVLGLVSKIIYDWLSK